MDRKLLICVWIFLIIPSLVSESYACDQDPVAEFDTIGPYLVSENMYYVPVGVDITFNGSGFYPPYSGSYDPDGGTGPTWAAGIKTWFWIFGDGYAYAETWDNAPDGMADGQTTHKYTTPGCYELKFKVYDNDAAEGGTEDHTDTLTCGVTAVALDLGIDGVSDDDEENPGGFVSVGDLKKINLSVSPTDQPGQVHLEVIGSYKTCVKIWSDQSKTNLVIPDGSNYYKRWNPDDMPTTLWVEGIAASALRYPRLGLHYIVPDEQSAVADVVNFTVYRVLTVIFDEYMDNDEITYHPANPPNGGKRIFPGKKNPSDPNPERRKIVKVKAYITPTLYNRKVYFKNFDVDDKSSVDPDGDGPDNNGGIGSLSATDADTDASGVATVDFTVTMYPGDNFKIAVSCSESQLEATDQTMVDYDNPPSGVELSEMLTVWRKLWIERDSMNEVASSGDEKNYVSGTASLYVRLLPESPPKTRVYLGQNLPSEMDDENQYLMSWYKVPDKSPYLVHYSSSRVWLEDYIDVLGDLNGDGADKDYDLYDDDYDYSFSPHITLPSYPDMGSCDDAFRQAYIEPYYLSSSDSDVVSFDRNLVFDDGEWNDGRNNPNSSGFWCVLSVTAFQPITSHDGDPEVTDVWLGEAHNDRNDLALYLEVIEHESGEGVSRVMAHEVAHTCGLDDCSSECILNSAMIV